MSFVIRTLHSADLPAVHQIYQKGIDTRMATFETLAPSIPELETKFLSTCRLVAELQGSVIGWAMLSPVSTRSVYAGVAEVSIYIHPEHRAQGVGSMLLQRLINESEQAGFWTLQAGIFAINTASIELHKKAGFRLVGFREKIGQLEGKWYDTVLMERRSTLIENPVPVSTPVIIEKAQPHDFDLIRTLLIQSHLPVSDLPVTLPHFFKATLTNNKQLAGVIGLELYAPYALVRSLAVDPELQNKKTGYQLLQNAKIYAAEKGINHLYLLTTSAQSYFEKQGFVKVERTTVPEEIMQTQQFAGLCPSSAILMHCAL